jgi:pimeloyl-ACP methyl ester carboxylesterase
MPQIHSEEHGPADGEPTLLIQGGEASLLWWPAELIDALVASGRRVIVYDNRDTGLSEYVTEPYALEDMAADAVDLLDALDIDRAHVVGLSMGGMIAQLVALRAPERVRSLALLCTTPGPDERLEPAPEGVFDDIDWDAGFVESTVAFARAIAGSAPPFDEGYYRRLCVADEARGVNPGGGHLHALNSAPSRLDALKQLRMPTLVAHGSEDPIFPFSHAEAMVAAIPQAQLVRWDGVGHELSPPLMRDLASRLSALL